ncbi:MAG: polysaccharide biosynthesis/export family protein [Chitinophagales bacterium]
MRKYFSFFLFGVVLLFLPSCKVLYPNLMFKQKDYQFFELAQKQMDQYVIQPGDALTLKVYSRDGFKLVDVLNNVRSGSELGVSMNTTNTNTSLSDDTRYLVDNEGFANIPVLGDFYVKGYTEAELQRVLSEKYSNLFVDPYVICRVVNRRVFVFKGGLASVVELNETPTNLLEVIARAGGLTDGTKAYNIKVIRGDYKNPQVNLVDLSTLEGLRKADLAMQPNDIVYIEKRQKVVSDIFKELAPYISILTSLSTIIALSVSFGKL